MISNILSIVAGFFSLFGWFRTKSDQATGEQLQQGSDLAASQKEAINAQANVDAVNALSDQQLDDQLRASEASD